ncbi:winged helix-turn-helix transcriptional regulator [Vibrio quintilis]
MWPETNTGQVYPEIPPRVDYAITDYGRTLTPVIHALSQWGKRKQR